MEKLFNLIATIDWGIVIAFVAILLTIMTIRDPRKHNKLSVRPIAIISVADYEDRLAVNLQNQGTGPLIIEKISIINNNEIRSSIIEFFDTDFEDITWSTFIGDIDGWAILPGSQRTLIEIVGDSRDKKFIAKRNRVRKVLANLKIEVRYCDIYEQKMPIKVRSLDFFAR